MIINFCVSFVVIYCTLYFFGYPLKVLLLNDDLRKFDLYITPWLGIGVIVVTLFPLSWLGYSVQSTAYYFAAAVAAANLAVWLKFREPVRVERREVALMAVTGLITASIYGGVLSLKGPEYFAVFTNPDYGLYLNNAKAALMSSALADSGFSSGTPLINSIRNTFNVQLRGCIFVQAFFAAFFRLELIHITYILSAFVMFLNAITFRVFLKKNQSIWGFVPVIIIFPLCVFHQKMVFWPFTGQLFSFGLTTLAFYIECYLSERKIFDPRTCVALILILTVNGLCYMEGSTFPLVPAAALMVSLALDKNYDRRICLSNAAFTGFFYMIVNYKVIVTLMGFLSFLSARPQGFPSQDFVTFADVIGVRGAFAGADGPEFIIIVMANVILPLILLRQMKMERPSSFLSVSLVLFFLAHAAVCAMYYRHGEDSSYNVLKSALSLSFIVFIFLSRFMEMSMSDLRGSGKFRFAAAAFVVFFCLNAVACWRGMEDPGRLKTGVHKQYDAIEIFTKSDNYKDAGFIVNFDLRALSFIASYYAPFGRTVALGRDQFWIGEMSMGNPPKDGDIYIVDSVFEEVLQTTDAELIFENDVYKIFRLKKDSIIVKSYAGISSGITIQQIQDDLFALKGVEESRAGIRLLSMEDRAVNMALLFYDGDGQDDMRGTIYVNGKLTADAEESGGFIRASLKDVQVRRGINDISIEFSGDVSELSLAGVEISR